MSAMSNESRFTVTTSNPSDLTVVGEYIPDDPVPFEAGYIFRVDQPQEPCRRLSVVYVEVPPGYGYCNYHRESDSPSFNTISGCANDYPPIAVNTSKNP